MKILMKKVLFSDLAAIAYQGFALIPVDQDIDQLPQDVEVSIVKRQRTNKQNSALHKYFTLLANTLNDGGLDQRKVLKPSVEIRWTPDSVKEYLWRPIQVAMLDKESTADLETPEIDQVYRVISKHLAEKFNITIGFPNARTQD